MNKIVKLQTTGKIYENFIINDLKTTDFPEILEIKIFYEF